MAGIWRVDADTEGKDMTTKKRELMGDKTRNGIIGYH